MTITREQLDEIEIRPLLNTLKLEKIDDAEYFSEKYNGYISNSRLSLINPEQDNDPKAFFEGLTKHNKYSDALIFGSAVHELILQPELFELVETVNRPTAKLGFMADELYLSYKSDTISNKEVIKASDKIGYYKGKMSSEKIENVITSCKPYWKARNLFEDTQEANKTPIYLDPKSRERVLECVRALNNNKDIQALLHPEWLIREPISENEQAILLDIQVIIPNKEPFILRLKSKLDNYTIDFETNTIIINDIKTIGKIVSEFDNNFKKFHYHRELAMYSWLMTLVAKEHYLLDNCTVKSNCLVVSTIPAYYTKVYTLTKSDFSKGWNEFKYLLKLVAYYYNKGYRFE